ncbi:MAG: succinylglutamate desuccinylase [Halomonadaceae bacterium]|nr:MAG: succinylglutamate desuccinylase [Halomonadaceae bacterium]
MARAPFELAGVSVAAGTRQRVEVPIAKLYTQTPLHIPVEVIHGRRPGPTLLVCGAIHGDEINGVEIVRRLLRTRGLQRLRGTLLAVPVVNVFGFLHQSRYLPDRRDLNRCFPGTEKGSLGGRIAYLFRTEVVEKASHIVDLHTGAIHRFNLPQIRADLAGSGSADLAEAFSAPIVINSRLSDGTLRDFADSEGIPCITYEAGEALRFDEVAINTGVRGVRRVMRYLDMMTLESSSKRPRKTPSRGSEVASSSVWMRAETDGIMRPIAGIGYRVKKGQKLAVVADPFGESEEPVTSSIAGIVVGMNNLPLVNEGEALYHVARFDELDEAMKTMTAFRDRYRPLAGEEPMATHPWDSDMAQDGEPATPEKQDPDLSNPGTGSA